MTPPTVKRYYCTAYITPDTDSVGGNRRIYVGYEPEDQLGRVFLNWLRARGVDKLKTTWFLTADSACAAVKEYCIEKHGGHTTPPPRRGIEYNPDFHDLFMRHVGPNLRYQGPKFEELHAMIARRAALPPIPSSSRQTITTSTRHEHSQRDAPTSHHAHSSQRQHSSSSRHRAIPFRSTASSSNVSPSTAPTTVTSPHRSRPASTAAAPRPPREASVVAPHATSPPPTASSRTPATLARAPRTHSSHTSHAAPLPSPQVPQAGPSVDPQERRVRELTRILTEHAEVLRWSQEARDAEEFGGSTVETASTVGEDALPFVVTSKGMVPELFPSWKQAQHRRKELLAERDGVLVHAPRSSQELKALLAQFK
ncbi:hypothetical protein EV715DRAFT_297832 [Schizophyllum commune]